MVQTIFGSLLASIVTIVAGIIAVAALSWYAALALAITAVLILIPARRFGRRVATYAHRQADASSRLQAFLAERLNVSGATLTQLFPNRRHDWRVFSSRAAEMRDILLERNAMFATARAMLSVLGAAGTFIVFLVGGLLVIHGDITVGTVVALAVLTQQVYVPLGTLITQGVDLSSGFVSFARVIELLDFPVLVVDGELSPVPGEGRLDFVDVTYCHPPAGSATLATLRDQAASEGHGSAAITDQTILGASFSILPNRRTALVGPTGAGKTTLANLAVRFFDPDSGAVLLDGVDIRDLHLDELRNAIGVVTQEAYLLNDSLEENLRIARRDATTEQLLSACQRAELEDVLRRLPDGLSTIVGDRGYRMSGGERQRIALARVFLKRPRIVVLDEATSHLDQRTEFAVQTALQHEFKHCGILFIAHRMSTVESADEILVLDRGRIVERGTHEALLVRRGLSA
jgi:ATP-binding cassette subfamily B protein